MIKEEILCNVDTATAYCERAATMICRSQGDASAIDKILFQAHLEIDLARSKLKQYQGETINFGYREHHPPLDREL